MKARYLFVVVLLLLKFSDANNTKFYGKIIDKESLKPLSYCNIYIDKTNLGTASNKNGDFFLEINDSLQNKKIIFNYIGYVNDTLIFNKNIMYDTLIIQMKSVVLKTDAITVTADKNLAEQFLVNTYNKIIENKEIFFSKSFYREVLSTEDKYLRTREIFYNIQYGANGIVDWHIIQGRDADLINDSKRLFIKIYNFSTFIRSMKFSQKRESFFTFLPFVNKKTFIIPIRENPDKYFKTEIIGYRIINDRETVQIKFYPKDNIKRAVVSGMIEIFTDNYEIINYKISADNYKELNTMIGVPDGFFINNTGFLYEYVAKIKPNTNHTVPAYINFNLTFHLNSEEENNDEIVENYKSFMYFYGFNDVENKFSLESMMGRENDTEIINKEIKYDPQFWSKNSKIITKIPLEKDILDFFKIHRFHGNMFPNGVEQ